MIDAGAMNQSRNLVKTRMLNSSVRVVSSAALERLVVIGLAALTLIACSNLDTHAVNIQTGAGGTQVEAKQVVALIYAQAPAAEMDKLLYRGGDLTRAVMRLYERFPRLKPWLDQGVIGNSSSGFLAIRDASVDASVRALVGEENRDRAFLHTQTSVAVGHDNQDINLWLPYASYTFGAQWIGQGAPEWWWLNPQQVWIKGRP